MTTRRAVLHVLGVTVLMAGPCNVSGQQLAKTPHVGVLWSASSTDPLAHKFASVLRQRLHELGYVEGKTISIDERFAHGSAQRLNELARELVDAKVSVIVAP